MAWHLEIEESASVDEVKCSVKIPIITSEEDQRL